jgi:hypothetical protein
MLMIFHQMVAFIVVLLRFLDLLIFVTYGCAVFIFWLQWVRQGAIAAWRQGH